MARKNKKIAQIIMTIGPAMSTIIMIIIRTICIRDRQQSIEIQQGDVKIKNIIYNIAKIAITATIPAIITIAIAVALI